jgi:hypothetical protein
VPNHIHAVRLPIEEPSSIESSILRSRRATSQYLNSVAGLNTACAECSASLLCTVSDTAQSKHKLLHGFHRARLKDEDEDYAYFWMQLAQFNLINFGFACLPGWPPRVSATPRS